MEIVGHRRGLYDALLVIVDFIVGATGRGRVVVAIEEEEFRFGWSR